MAAATPKVPSFSTPNALELRAVQQAFDNIREGMRALDTRLGTVTMQAGQTTLMQGKGDGTTQALQQQIAGLRTDLDGLAGQPTSTAAAAVQFITLDGEDGADGAGLPAFGSEAYFATLAVYGNAGIGAASAGYRLQVAGAGQITGALTDAGNKGASLYLLDTDATAAGQGGALLFGGFNKPTPFAAIKGFLTDSNNNTRGGIVFSSRGATTNAALTERMRMDMDGVLLVGATSRTAYGGSVPRQEIYAGNIAATDGDGGTLALFGATNSAGGGAGLTFGGAFMGTSFATWARIRSPKDTSVSGEYGGGLAFDTRVNGASLAERMVLTSAGLLGIGNSAPSYSLMVGAGSGTQIAALDGGTAAGQGAAFFYRQGGQPKGIFGNEATILGSGSSTRALLQAYSDALGLRTVTSQPITFDTGGVERMRIDAAGKVSVGTPGPAQFNVLNTGTIHTLQVVNTSIGSGSTLVMNASNAVDADFNVLLSQCGAASKFAMMGPSVPVPFIFQTNAIERMRIDDATGNLIVARSVLPGTVFTSTMPISGWAANSFNTIMPAGSLPAGFYTVFCRWDHMSSGPPFIVAAAFPLVVVNTNGSGQDASFLPLAASHTGSASTLTFRAIAALASFSGLQVALSFTGDGIFRTYVYRTA